MKSNHPIFGGPSSSEMAHNLSVECVSSKTVLIFWYGPYSVYGMYICLNKEVHFLITLSLSEFFMQWDLKKLSFIGPRTGVWPQLKDHGSSSSLGCMVSSWPPCLCTHPHPCHPPLHPLLVSSKLSRSFFWPQINPRTLNSSHKFPQVWFPLLYPALPPPILPLVLTYLLLHLLHFHLPRTLSPPSSQGL